MQIYNDVIYFIQFKNIKLAMDIDVFTFLGEIKNNCIELNANINRFLLEKFKINKFDLFTKNPIHIKFLVEYSPILSKFVDPSEFNDIEFINLHSDIIDIWRQEDIYYIDFSKNVKFFNTEETEIDVATKTLHINIDPKLINRIEAIILSMTPKERRNPEIIKASRKTRIAKGSGTSVQEVNKLLTQFDQMKKMMKQMTNGNFKMPF